MSAKATMSATSGDATRPADEIVRVRMSDGYEVAVSRYAADGEAKAAIVANHGIQSHAGWFERTSRDLAAAGFDVWFCDRRGSGLNTDQRGHARGGGRLVEDVRQVVAAAQQTLPERPIVLHGLCWGAKIAAAAAADPRIQADALLLLYPSLFQKVRGSLRDRFRLHTGRFLGASKRLVPLPLPEQLFTSDPHWQQFIREDPAALKEISVGTLFAGRDLDWARNAASIRCPTLVQLAGDDAIVHNRQIETWAKRLAGHSTVIEYPNVAHVLEFDAIREQSVTEAVAWLSDVLKV